MKTQERVFVGNPVSSGEEHGDIDTAYKYRLPNGLLGLGPRYPRAVLFHVSGTYGSTVG